jgi:hypothetical protein
MNVRLSRLLVIFVALVALCGLTLPFGWTSSSYAGGPEATPTCDCTGGMNPTPVPNSSSIVGYVYDYSTGPPVPRKGIGVKLTGCSWSAVWGTDDYGYFYFDNLGQGVAQVNLQLPPNGHAINPNVIVDTSGLTETYTVYLGFYLGDTPPSGELTTPDGKPLTGSSTSTTTLPPGSTTDETLIPSVGGTLPDSYLVIGLSAMLLLLLPVAGLVELTRRLTPDT